MNWPSRHDLAVDWDVKQQIKPNQNWHLRDVEQVLSHVTCGILSFWAIGLNLCYVSFNSKYQENQPSLVKIEKWYLVTDNISKFNFWSVHGIRTLSGILQSKYEARSVHDAMNRPKIEFIFLKSRPWELFSLCIGFIYLDGQFWECIISFEVLLTKVACQFDLMNCLQTSVSLT